MTDEEILVKMNLKREEFSSEIRAKMRNSKPRITQRKMCEDLGFFPQNLCAFLNGRAKLSFKKVKMITDYLNM